MTNQSAKEQVREILDIVVARDGEVEGMTTELHEKVVDQALSQIEEIVKEVLGEDEPCIETASNSKNWIAGINNKLRAERLERWSKK